MTSGSALRVWGVGTARTIRVIEERLADGRAHLLGDGFSIADLHVVSCVAWSGFVGIEASERMHAYIARMTERDAYCHAVLHNFTPAPMAALKRAQRARFGVYRRLDRGVRSARGMRSRRSV